MPKVPRGPSTHTSRVKEQTLGFLRISWHRFRHWGLRLYVCVFVGRKQKLKTKTCRIVLLQGVHHHHRMMYALEEKTHDLTCGIQIPNVTWIES